MKKLIPVCLLFLITLSGYSQKILAVENVNKLKRVKYFPGDYIRFQGHDGEAKYYGFIESVDDSMVVLVKSVKFANSGDETNNMYRDYVPLREIAAVYNTDKTYWRYFKNMYSATAMISGGVLIGGTSLNTLLENDTPDPQSLIIATGILFSGFIVKYIGRDKYKVGGNRKWQIRAMEPIVEGDIRSGD
ncbi:MAG: hypothetical protein SF052_00905 [Bacteroidia bacterium]|nr:hypothetical protein [Bacteroidia bacterium]